ncbi:MAG: type III-A CRISPR-associated RAMP protein Csm4 [Bacteroidota bacterium]
MKKYTLYRFRCRNNTRIQTGLGLKTPSDDFIHSDTLFSAIINTFVLLYGQEHAENFIEEFISDHIKISSLFYYADIFKGSSSVAAIEFFPAPRIAYDIPVQTRTNPYISYKVWELMRNDVADTQDKYSFPSGVLSMNNEFFYHESELPAGFARSFKQPVQESKAEINRLTVQAKKDRTYYQSGFLLSEFTENGYRVVPGMYFLADMNSAMEDKFLASLRLLCDEGIGAERSFGKGIMTSVEAGEFQASVKRKLRMNISLVYPSEKDYPVLDTSLIKYSLIERGGWSQKGVLKNRVNMIREGSLMKDEIAGHIVDVTPQKFTEHRLYQYGKGLYI